MDTIKNILLAITIILMYVLLHVTGIEPNKEIPPVIVIGIFTTGTLGLLCEIAESYFVKV